MNRCSLISAFDLKPNFDPSDNYTRCNVKTNSYTLIDGILLSRSLTSLVSDVRILHHGDNLSDHSPVEIDISLALTETEIPLKKFQPCILWKKLDHESTSLYRQKMTDKLDEIQVPTDFILHGNQCCDNDTHRNTIEDYYHNVVDAVKYAESFLPKSKPDIQRSFWSDSLNELKQRSIDCCYLWKEHGMPRSGPIFECKKACTYRYKGAIRKAKKTRDEAVNNSLHDYLCDRDSDSFWKSWRNENKAVDSLVTRIDGVTGEKDVADAFAVHFQRVYSGSESSAHLSLKSEFEAKFSDFHANHSGHSLLSYYFSWADMVNVVKK